MTNPSAGENACFYGQPFAGEVATSTPQMVLTDGEAIAVIFYSPAAIGSYPANSPAADRLAIVRARRTTRPAGGGDSGDWYASSGTLSVTQAVHVGDPSNWGVIAGTVNAQLAWADGSKAITVKGTWGCVIDPTANKA